MELPQPSSCTASEFPQLVELVNYSFRRNGGDMLREYPFLFNSKNLDNLRIIKDQNRPVVTLH